MILYSQLFRSYINTYFYLNEEYLIEYLNAQLFLIRYYQLSKIENGIFLFRINTLILITDESKHKKSDVICSIQSNQI